MCMDKLKDCITKGDIATGDACQSVRYGAGSVGHGTDWPEE